MKKKVSCIILIVLLCVLASCGKEKNVDGDYVIPLYYVGNAGTKVVMREYALVSTTVEEKLGEIVDQLSRVPEKLEYKPPFAQGFSVLGYCLEENVLYLDVDDAYRNLSPTQEVLTRAALVRSFTQLEEVTHVTMTVEGETLYDSLGNVVGIMAADQFIDSAGNEINTYDEVRLKLYFANETGDGLVAVYRDLHYNTNIPTEKLVVEQILAGVEVADTGCYPTVNPEVKLLNVMVKDGICYVNFDKTFLTPIYNVTPEVTIYSLVNSLTELINIHKVRILIEGEENVNYRETIMLTTFFERNLDVMRKD